MRKRTGRLLNDFDSENSFHCEDGRALSGVEVASRFVPTWPGVIRNFSVALAE